MFVGDIFVLFVSFVLVLEVSRSISNQYRCGGKAVSTHVSGDFFKEVVASADESSGLSGDAKGPDPGQPSLRSMYYMLLVRFRCGLVIWIHNSLILIFRPFIRPLRASQRHTYMRL
jgi:hypothetical protein